MTLPDKWIIRTSDRGLFRECRQKWDFRSKLRMGYQATTSAHYFEFGTAVHNGLEIYYRPELWDSPREVVEQMALAGTIETNKRQMRNAAEHNGGSLDIDKEQEYKEREELGRGMLEGYFAFAKKNDQFKPVYSEIEFETPIVVPEEHLMDLPSGFTYITHRDLDVPHLYYQGIPCVYQGRIDLIVEAEDGYWIYDHKTAARFESTEWVDKDPQVSSYCWAIGLLGVQVEGFVMNELKKVAATPPKVLQSRRKGRILSVSKSQGTTYELYMKAIEEHGENPAMYEDILTHLQAQDDDEFFRRIRTYRTPDQIAYAGEKVFEETVDMLNNPSIYPNASKWNCRGCPFNTPCLQRTEGSDWQFTLQNEAFFTKRA